MKKLLTKAFASFILLILCSFSIIAQTKITGKVTDASTKETLIGVSIAVKGKVIGTITDANGNFTLNTNTPKPFTLLVTMVGYEKQEIPVTGNKTDFQIALKEQTVLGQDIVVSASRMEESILQSPVTVEKMDIRAIRETPSASFYDALRNLKGVELSSQSVSFSSINMRGFGSNGNVRVVQMIDGMDNQAPGLNFSVGNIVGISELDLEGVEVLPGAASALYGPNAINGLLLMNSKSPFLYQGLSAQVKTGFMNAKNREVETTPYGDISIRYAKAFNNKVAIKFNFNRLTAQDWEATDYRDQSLLNGSNLATGTRSSNYAFNGVNIYGDETNVNMYSSLLPLLADRTNPLTAGINQISAATGGLLSPTTILGYVVPNASISREGFKENDLASYGNKNVKFNAALHYRFNDKLELILQGNYGQGTTVYTGADRYSIKDFSMGQYKAELKGSNFFIRAYTTQENSGDAYATGTLGALVNEYAKPSTAWYPTFFQTFAGLSLTRFATELQTNLLRGQAPTTAIGNAVAANTAAFPTYFGTARLAANAPATIGGIAYPGQLLPGSAAFRAAVEDIKNNPLPRGARFLDKSALYHYEGMYNFTEKLNNKLELLVGANYRIYALNSEGTLFALDDNGKEFNIHEYGGYVQLGKKFIQDKLKLTGSMRYDKNENFDGQFSPRLSGVFTQGNSNFRVSYQTGFRIPTTQDQYIDLNTPTARLLGGLPVVQNRYNLSGNSFTLSSIQAGKPEVYTAKEWKPERVATIEIGYKGTLFENLLADFYIYNSTYTNFSAGTQVVQTPAQHKDPNVLGNKVYSFQTNASGDVKTKGWGLSLEYRLPGNWVVSGNASKNELEDNGGLRSEILSFNTPLFRTNVSFGNRNIANSGWGINAVWRFQEGFVWQSSIVNSTINQLQQSFIPQFNTLDLAFSKKVSEIKSIIKVGGTNILGTPYTTGWANPTIGSMFYVSITFDELLNK